MSGKERHYKQLAGGARVTFTALRKADKDSFVRRANQFQNTFLAQSQLTDCKMFSAMSLPHFQTNQYILGLHWSKLFVCCNKHA